MSFEYKYRFKKYDNSNEFDIYDEIYEVKYLNLPKDTPKSQKYQWFLLRNSVLHKLTFKSMEDNKRIFEEGILIMTCDGCIFNGEEFTKY